MANSRAVCPLLLSHNYAYAPVYPAGKAFSRAASKQKGKQQLLCHAHFFKFMKTTERKEKPNDREGEAERKRERERQS